MKNQGISQAEIERLMKRMPEEIEISKLSRAQITALQERRLREMLVFAKNNSPWYAERFKHINADTFKLSDLAQIPIMSKNDLMDNWDTIVTDNRLKLVEVSKFMVEQTGCDLFYGYHIFGSGGSSGRRGIFVWDPEELSTMLAGWLRYAYRDDFQNIKPNERMVVASVASVIPVHLGPFIYPAKVIPQMQSIVLGADYPIETLIDALNKHQPTHLNGYPSIVSRLAEHALHGDLKISPRRLILGSEPLFPQMLETINKAWPTAIVNNLYGCTDTGAHAIGCDYSGSNLHLNEDLVIIEPVDIHNTPVKIGQKSDKILATTLHHKSLPLFRYELDDSITVSDKPCPCGASFKLIESITGRNEDNFVYHKNIVAVPLLFCNVFYKYEGIDEYQVFQTENGVKVWFISADYAKPDVTKIQSVLITALEKIGLKDPEVSIELVNKLKRHPLTGKLKRFVSIHE